MANFIALFDAFVLYPAPLRDLLMHLALTDLFRAKWSDAIHDEWIRNVLKSRPELTPTQLQRTRELMDMHVRDCLVKDYEKLMPWLLLPDLNDRHVLAAAIRSSASVIVTYNLKDFPSKMLDEFEIEAQHPDTFISHLIDLAPGIVCGAIKKLRANLKNPPLNPKDYLEILERQSLSLSVSKLREYEMLI